MRGSFPSSSSRFLIAAGLHQGLRSHLITGSVVGIGFDERSEFRQCSRCVSSIDILHRESIARKRVFWILRKGLLQHDKAVHSLSVGESADHRLEDAHTVAHS